MQISKLRLLRGFVYSVLWLLALEALFRLPLVQRELHDYIPQNQWWYSIQVNTRINMIQQNLQADIWFAGSSVVITGIDPIKIEAVTPQADHLLNIGLNGLVQIKDMQAYLDQAFLPLAQPRWIVVGVFPPGFSYSPPPKFAAAIETVAIRFDRWDYQLGAWLNDHSALYRHLRAMGYFFVQVEQEQYWKTVTPQGWVPLSYAFSEYDENRYIPTTSSNNLLSEGLQQLNSLRQFLNARGIQMAVVNFPMNSRYMVRYYPAGEAGYSAYQTKLAEAMTQSGIPYLDLHNALQDVLGKPLPLDYFADYTHLRDNATQAVADVVGAWLVKSGIEGGAS